MPKEVTRPQTRFSTLLVLARNALILGLAAAAVGAGIGYFGGEATWAGALRGINWGSLVLAIYAGLIVVGHSQIRQIDRNIDLQHVRTAVSTGDVYPWGAILTALLGSLSCVGLWLLLRWATP